MFRNNTTNNQGGFGGYGGFGGFGSITGCFNNCSSLILSSIE